MMEKMRNCLGAVRCLTRIQLLCPSCRGQRASSEYTPGGELGRCAQEALYPAGQCPHHYWICRNSRTERAYRRTHNAPAAVTDTKLKLAYENSVYWVCLLLWKNARAHIWEKYTIRAHHGTPLYQSGCARNAISTRALASGYLAWR